LRFCRELLNLSRETRNVRRELVNLSRESFSVYRDIVNVCREVFGLFRELGVTPEEFAAGAEEA
jgi:hypothetical protein